MAKGKHRRSFRDERVSQCWCFTETSTRIPSVSDGSGDNMISADKHVRFYKNRCYLIVGGKNKFVLFNRFCSWIVDVLG